MKDFFLGKNKKKKEDKHQTAEQEKIKKQL